MSLEEDIRPVTFLKNRTAALLAQINETHRPVVITQNGEARAVLQDLESYQQMRKALGMLKLLAQGEDDVRAARTIPQGQVFARVRKQLKTRQRKRGKTQGL